jgi:hypothetical protein
MRRWQVAQQYLKGLFLVALILASCAAPGGDNPAEGCGGTEAAISCLEVTGIVPTSRTEGNTSNVDAFQELCVDSTTGAVTLFETFIDHNADVTFANGLFPTATTGFDIRILGYTVAYRLNQCPAGARGCPPLTGFTVSGESILVPDGQSRTVSLPFVPLRVKNEFCAAGGETGAAIPSYTAIYTFTAQTTRLNDTFTVTGSAQFTLGNFITGGFTCVAPGIRFLADC